MRNDLKLSPEQQPRWNAYRQKIEALAGDIAQAGSTLYSSFNAEQKEIADRRLVGVARILAGETDDPARRNGAGLPRMQ